MFLYRVYYEMILGIFVTSIPNDSKDSLNITNSFIVQNGIPLTVCRTEQPEVPLINKISELSMGEILLSNLLVFQGQVNVLSEIISVCLNDFLNNRLLLVMKSLEELES